MSENKFSLSEPESGIGVVTSVFRFRDGRRERCVATAQFLVPFDGATIEAVRKTARAWGSSRCKLRVVEDGRRERVDDPIYGATFAADQFGTDGTWRNAISTPFWAS